MPTSVLDAALGAALARTAQQLTTAARELQQANPYMTFDTAVLLVHTSVLEAGAVALTCLASLAAHAADSEAALAARAASAAGSEAA
jgi:hypothetical protein